MKNLLNLNGAQKLSKDELTEINGGKAAPHCPGTCNYSGQDCWVNGHCNCPGKCANVLGQLTCSPR